MNNKYAKIIDHYEKCFEKYGDTPKGLDWPNLPDLLKRYEVMLGLIRKEDVGASLLDFGCGTARLFEFINRNHSKFNLRYSGLDLGETFTRYCREKYPQIKFYHTDLLKDRDAIPAFDYIIMNGVFTEKASLSFDEMFTYFKKLILSAFQKTIKGLAFNVMSKHVDWERDDLFHLPLDTLAAFLTKELTRSFIIRNDYGLYEYTTYVYKRP